MSDPNYTNHSENPTNQYENTFNVNVQQPSANLQATPVTTYPVHPNMMQQYNYMGYYNYPYYMNQQLMYQYQNQEQVAQNNYESVQKCHLHSKPDLNCKYCRKFKSAVHEISRLAQQNQTPQTEDKPNQIPMTNSVTYNMNDLLRNNILSSEYYKSLSVKTFHDIVDELVQFGSHCEPYCNAARRAPSTMFCCLYKFFTMKLTEKQMTHLLEHPKSPYPRCCGLLYLRYVLPPDKLWNWFEPYFLDDESFTVSSENTKETTIGEFAESLIMEDKYYNTVLPRLPVRVKNLFGAHLLEMSQHRKRRVRNMDFVDYFVEGAQVSACSKGDWLDGEIVTVTEGRQGYPLVTVSLEDGTEETLDIGYVSLKGKEYSKSKDKRRHSRSRSRERSEERRKRSRSRSRDRPESGRKRSRSREAERRRSRSRDRYRRDDKYTSSNKEDLLKEFKRREREKALATGKDYGKRPSSYKSSLSSRLNSKNY